MQGGGLFPLTLERQPGPLDYRRPKIPRRCCVATLVPVLALNGSLDPQVLADVNVPALEAALQEAGNERASVLKLEGLNHLFQHATTGSPREYAQIQETMAPEVLTQISEWIVGLPPRDPGEAPDGGLSDGGP